MTHSHIHLVGSVPLKNAAEVFDTVGRVLGPLVHHIPDGETGERGDWITWLEPVFANNPSLEKSDEVFRVHANAASYVRYRLKPGKTIADLKFDDLHYGRIAMESYREFEKLQKAGHIPASTKFQVALAPAHSTLWLFLQENLQRAADPIYNAALKREIDKMAAAIPHEKLAIQFDVASAVFARMERRQAGPYGQTREEMQDVFTGIMTDLGNHVPRDIDLLFHLCYGDADHKHAAEPTDMGDMVDFTNRLLSNLKRSVEVVHMPVPRNRTDDAYFAPLSGLKLPSETKLVLGLVHYTDGVSGTRQRIAAAEKYARDFGVATECGFGRRPVETIPELLRIHKEVASDGR